LASIQIVPLAPDDWVVREEGGREIGHFASQAEAEAVGQALARKRKAHPREARGLVPTVVRGRLPVHLPDLGAVLSRCMCARSP
jgi:hypothetical protein